MLIFLLWFPELVTVTFIGIRSLHFLETYIVDPIPPDLILLRTLEEFSCVFLNVILLEATGCQVGTQPKVIKNNITGIQELVDKINRRKSRLETGGTNMIVPKVQ